MPFKKEQERISPMITRPEGMTKEQLRTTIEIGRLSENLFRLSFPDEELLISDESKGITDTLMELNNLRRYENNRLENECHEWFEAVNNMLDYIDAGESIPEHVIDGFRLMMFHREWDIKNEKQK